MIIRELIPVQHKSNPLPEAIDLDKVLRKLKLKLTGMISRHQKIMELMVVGLRVGLNVISLHVSGLLCCSRFLGLNLKRYLRSSSELLRPDIFDFEC